MARGAIKIGAPELRLDPERIVESVDWHEVFGAVGPVEVEVGIGKGRFLLAAAAARPEVLHLGVEWANKYLRIAEHRAKRDGLKNVRFARVDARELVCRAIPAVSVAAYYVFYPDPWPKKRHHKRRLIQKPFVEAAVQCLVPGGHWAVQTDHAEYFEAIADLLRSHPDLREVPFDDPEFGVEAARVATNFEIKYAKEGRTFHQIAVRRR